MAKKLDEIKKEIDSKAKPFREYFERELNDEFVSLINKLSKKSHVYIFSGIIRDFFLKREGIRDVDVVIDGDIQIENYFKKYKYRKNSFGGYKIEINDLTVDLWFLKDTWALKFQKTLDFDLANYIPSTAFFNFSSIIFSYNETKFFYTKDFIRFLRDKTIDLVFKPNANNALCVVNSLYYKDKLNFKLGDSLKFFIKNIYKSNIEKYSETQIKHFNEVLYSDEVIKNRIDNF